MANDVYVKFGDGQAQGGPLNTFLPEIMGDSTDAVHYWWCELRECGFDMETPQQLDAAAGQNGGDDSSGTSAPSSSGSNNKPASGFKSVKLRKRVDWASTQLFMKCCQAAMAKDTKATDDQADGRIGMVTVEVCRPTSTEQPYVLDDGTVTTITKIPCAKVEYKGVRIIRYEISINTPEPAESITFEFDAVRFTFVQTNPETGEVMDKKWTSPWMDNHHPESRSSAGDTNSSSANPATGGNGASGNGNSGGNGTPGSTTSTSTATPVPAAPGAAPDPTVNVNYPGLWQGTGFGVLPD